MIRSDRSAALAIFATLFVAYAYFFGGSGFNQNASFDLTRSLVERRALDIDPYASNTADVSFANGHVYSNKAPGLSFLAAVPYAAIYAVAGAPRASLELTRDLYLSTVAVCATSGAGIGVVLFLLLRRRRFDASTSAAMALVAGLGTPLFAYSTMLFAHVPSAFLVLAALYLIEIDKRLLAGASLGLAGLTNYLCLPLAILFLLLPLNRSGRRIADIVRIVVGALPFAIVLAVYQALAFGSMFRTSIATTNPAFLERGAFLGVFHGVRADALLGITFSPFRGLFYIAPVLLMAIPGLLLMMRQAAERATAALIALSTATLLLINASFNGWHGGYTIGPRYLLPAVPLLMLAAAYGAMRLRLLFALVATISLFFNFAAAAVDPQPPDTLHDPLGRYEIPALLFGGAGPNDEAVPVWIRQLYTGHTSTNRVAADELMPFSRYKPGSPETEWASFNLGELLFGPGSAMSLVPFFALMAGGVVVTLRLAGVDRAPR